MTGPSTYTPTTKFTRWLDTRLPILRFANDTMTTFPTPRNLNVWYSFGGILTFCLAVQIVTGIVLAMHYVPNSDLAFDSVEDITRDVNYGWLLRYVHANGASMFFIAVYLHIFRGLYYGSYKAPREILWILGVIIFVVMIATAFLGYVLPWGQMSFWAATVITSLFSSLDQLIPGLGTHIVQWLWGGFGVSNATLNRFYSLHYLLPFVLVGLVALHVWALHVPGNNNPLGIEVKEPQDTLPFHPYYTVKDIFYLALFVIFFAIIVFYAPDVLGNPDNYTPANPLVTPPDIVPDWYLMPFYAMLRSVPQKLVGVLVLFGALATLLFVPWLDTSRVRSGRFRPLFKPFFWVFAIDCILLGYCGSQSVEAAWNLGAFSIPLIWVARFGTIYYYAYFWLALPIIGLVETPLPLPDSIARSVLGNRAAAPAPAPAPAE
ncbi:MAG TPA: cytochrome b/b6 [Rhizomicrobium sp.]|jgi:ubiquinol-cytochrome c reductase cytochrome b subunit|nr:cytochrome b/b6 [Rhizomicrobium sp.]